MDNCDRISDLKSRITKWLAFVGTSLVFGINCTSVQSQIIPDNTLGNENSQVRTDRNIDNLPAELIEGGAQRESNLFHSFGQFNIEAGRGAYFANPEGVTNIFSRVTGSNVSEIMGRLGVQGNADLFLINPNGIIFGENSSLDINGSFVGSSADSVVFGNGFEFSAVNPEASPLLTVNMPLGLNLGNNPGDIVNNSITDNVGLQVLSGKNISLIGGNLKLNRGLITAPGGTVELGGLAKAGLIAINEDSSFNFPQEVAKADVSLTNDALVDVRADGGGLININAGNLNLSGESALFAGIAENAGSSNAQAGNITLNVAEAISLSQESRIENQVNQNSIGNSGDININANLLSATDGSVITTDTSGQGDGGLVSIQALDKVELSRAAIFSDVNSSAQGNGAGIEIDTGSLSVNDGAIISSSVSGRGNAGNINIFTDSLSTTASILDTSNVGQGSAGSIDISANNNVKIESSLVRSLSGSPIEGSTNGGINIDAESLLVTDNAELNSSLIDGGKGSAGDIIINASNKVTFDGGFARSRLEKGAEGSGGNISINTGSLLLTGLDPVAADAMTGQLTTATFGQGDAGSIIIKASGDVAFDGRGSDLFSLVALDEGIGNGGNIEINSNSLSINNQARLIATSEGMGNAGNIIINTNSFSVANQGQLNTVTSSENTEVEEVDEGGNIEIDTKSFLATSGSILNAGTSGTDNAGNIIVKASESALLDEANITATTIREGEGGNIELEIADSLLLRNNSRISATAGSESTSGGGGNIRINANQLKLENSLIDASTLGTENAGTITINATESVEVTGFGFARLQENVLVTAIEDPTIIKNVFSSGDVNVFNPNIVQGILAITSGQGEAGGIEINTPQLSVLDGSIIGSTTINQGAAGAIVINASELLNIDRAIVSASTLGTGNAGDVDINTEKLSINNGGQIAVTTLNSGNAGNLTVKATELVELKGVFENTSARSGLMVGSQREATTGSGGDLQIFTPQLLVGDGATIAATTLGQGDGGNIKIETTDTVDVVNSGTIAVSSTGQGNAGELNIQTNSLTLEDSSQLLANTVSSEGGNVQLEIAKTLLLSDQSSISTTAGTEGAGGNGGNIKINAGFLVASPLENSDIIANAFEGNGGNIDIEAQGIFGIEERSFTLANQTNDIDASSEFGLSGTVEIDILEVDPSQSSLDIPVEPVQAEVAQTCERNMSANQSQSEFVVTGRGGLPPEPEDNFRLGAMPSASSAIARNEVAEPMATPENGLKSEASPPIVEATGWVRNAEGKIVLLASSPTESSLDSQSNSAKCNL